MNVKTAIIPLAGRATRLYPASSVLPKGLMPIVDTDGIAKASIQLMLEECVSSGIERVILVVNPDSEAAYKRYFSPLSEVDRQAYASKPAALQQSARLEELGQRITYAIQAQPLGFGHAVHCARPHTHEEPFAVLLGDHLFLSDTDTPCLKQTLDAAAQTQNDDPLYAVHAIPEETIHRFGIIGGSEQGERLYSVSAILEKPTREQAQEKLQTTGLPARHYLAHFGIYLFPARAMQILETLIAETKQGEVQLTDAQVRLLQERPALAFRPRGSSHDFGVPEGIAETQQAFARRAGLI